MSNTEVKREKPEGYVFGRPTKYRSEMCEQVVEWGAEGKSRAWMAAKLGVNRSTIDEWAKVHEDFSEALTRAKALEQMWWEDKGQECLVMPQGMSFSQSTWSRSMAARFPDDWRETSRQEQTGPNGGPVQREITHLGLDEFTSRIARISARAQEGGGDSETEPGSA